MIDDLPELPRHVQVHDLAASPSSWRRSLGPAGAAVGSDREHLICVVGDPDPAATCALARERTHVTMLVPAEALAVVEALRGTGRRVLKALLHTLPDPSGLPADEGGALLPDDADLGHLPADLAAEITLARRRTPVYAAWVDGEPVSFAYAAGRSQRYFDCAVDTAPGARQLGLATIVAATMIRAERAAGREAVWGAIEDNHASRRLAARLGFELVDALWVVEPLVH